MNRRVCAFCYNIGIVADGMQNIVPASGFVRTLVRALLQLSCLKENQSISQCLFKGVSGRSNRRLCDSLSCCMDAKHLFPGTFDLCCLHIQI